MEIFSALRNCRSVSRVGSTCLQPHSDAKPHATVYVTCMWKAAIVNCATQPFFSEWEWHAGKGTIMFPHASHLWVWLLLFLLILESICLHLIFLRVWFEEKGWLDVSPLLRLGLSLAVSVLEPSSSFPLEWHEHTYFLWTLPPTSHLPWSLDGHARFSQDQRCILESSCGWACLNCLFGWVRC